MQSFDKLRRNGCLGDIQEPELRRNLF